MKVLLVLAAAGALVIGLVAVAGAGAQAGPGNAQVGDFVTRLADRLGISEEELTAAVKDVETDMVNDAVADGRLTEEQGARLTERIENGELRFPGGGPGPGVRCGVREFVLEASAEVLGIEVGQLEGKLNSGMSLVDIAEEQGMTADEFEAALTAEVEADLQAKVDAGEITQEQMDRMLERFTTNVDRIINHEPEPGFPGRCHGRHGPPADEGAALES